MNTGFKRILIILATIAYFAVVTSWIHTSEAAVHMSAVDAWACSFMLGLLATGAGGLVLYLLGWTLIELYDWIMDGFRQG